MTDCQYDGEDEDEPHDTITAKDLNNGKHIHSLITPVAGLVQQLDKVRLPHVEHPVVAHDEPDEQKQRQNGLREL